MSMRTLLKREDRELPIPLTLDEKLAAGHELALELAKARDHDDRKKNIAEAMKAERSEIDARVLKLSTLVERGEREDKVEVEAWAFHEDRIVIVTRKDTGQEIMRRPMTHAECQLPIDFVAPPKIDETVADDNTAEGPPV